MFNSQIDPIVHERYKTASIVRWTANRFNPQPSKPIIDYVQSHGITYHRMREIDVLVEKGAVDSDAPRLIADHINAGINGAISHLDNWDSMINILGSGRTAYKHATAWVSSTLDARILPAMYAAKFEIDPQGVYESKYIEYRDEYLNTCADIHTKFNNKQVRRTRKIIELEKQQLKMALEEFVSNLEDWRHRALTDLAPSSN